MVLRTVHSMFDWPEHSHTSPMSRSFTFCARVAVRAVSVCLPPLRSAGSVTAQAPAASACVLRV